MKTTRHVAASLSDWAVSSAEHRKEHAEHVRTGHVTLLSFVELITAKPCSSSQVWLCMTPSADVCCVCSAPAVLGVAMMSGPLQQH